MGIIFSTIFHHLPWQSSMDTPAASRRRQVLRMPNVEAKVLRTSPGKRLKAILASQLFQAPCDGGAATGFSFGNCWVYLGTWWFSYGKLWKMKLKIVEHDGIYHGIWWFCHGQLWVSPWSACWFCHEKLGFEDWVRANQAPTVILERGLLCGWLNPPEIICLVVTGTMEFSDFPETVGNVLILIPTDELIFVREVETTNQLWLIPKRCRKGFTFYLFEACFHGSISRCFHGVDWVCMGIHKGIPDILGILLIRGIELATTPQ